MGRLVRAWKPERVEDYEVAPHRYLYNDPPTAALSFGKPESFGAWFDSIPYKEGEVVYIDCGGAEPKRAKIYAVVVERDLYGERREVYKVQYETKAGLFSKLWEKTSPGYVQRGYQKAGLAPDVPAND